jgi:hypothetical protein
MNNKLYSSFENWKLSRKELKRQRQLDNFATGESASSESEIDWLSDVVRHGE